MKIEITFSEHDTPMTPYDLRMALQELIGMTPRYMKERTIRDMLEIAIKEEVQ